MRHYLSVVVAFALMTAFATGPALANPPSPSNSTVPSHIRLVAGNGIQPSIAFGEFEVVYRDLANNPMPGAIITVVLPNPDLRLCAEQPYPGVQVDCAGRRAWAITDAAGRARFTLLGGSNGAGGATTILSGAQIYADGVLIGGPRASAFDLDGAAGVGGSDLSVFIEDFASGQPWQRSDFDGSGSIGGADLAVWLSAFSSGTQVVSCASTCP